MPWQYMLPINSGASHKYYITIVNLTPYRFVKTSQNSYQFDVFDFGDIPSGKARQNTMTYTNRVGANPVDDNGEAYYQLQGTGRTFTIRGTTHIPGSYPMRTVVDLTGMGLGQREYGDPAPEASVTLVITGSEQYGYITSLDFGQQNNWMRQLYDVIKGRQLRHVVMPGSHDAGMGTISQAWIGLGSSPNTQTQGLNTYDQLRAGSRWFDMRLVSVNGGDFWAAHVNDETSNTPVGATGEAVNDIIAGINRFTQESPGEVIILWVRYLVNLDSSIDGRTRYWSAAKANEFYTKLESINNRCTSGLDKTTKFDRLAAQKFLDQNGGKGCVLIMTDGRLQAGVPTERPASGIFHGPDWMDRDDFWANKGDTASLAAAQVAHMTGTPRDNGGGDSFLITQWQCTPDVVTATLYGLSSIAILPTNPSLYWAAVNSMSPEAWPTVVLQDYLGLIHTGESAFPGQLGAEARVLAMGLNLYMVSQNCAVSSRRSPLLKSRVAAASVVASDTSAAKAVAAPAADAPFAGVIYANGTVDRAPAPGFHLGRPAVLKNGTVLGNGTVLSGDRPNPHFRSKLY
ncbi:PLC-like phosphodiesterase [Lasiosphaeria ovina]|uniref:PLC-like phosphodiesterase n=1 Tax=Lasiosphaeria ovina TaxID=92902 RepID=A0AAE0KI07_9PEZI|nr:PLC-like phosphodiesterase [Lasiosphaeria ovina]